MSAELEIENIAEFQKTLNAYLQISQKECASALNTKMYFIVAQAAKDTPRQERHLIEQELGVTGYRAIYNHERFYAHKKKGGVFRISKTKGKKGVQVGSRNVFSASKTKRKNAYDVVTKPGALIYRIIQARMARSGQKGLWGTEMRRAAANLMSKRFRTVGTLKSGWSGPIRKLGAALGMGTKNEGAASGTKGAGRATVARPGLNPETSAEYRVNSFDKAHRSYIDPRVSDALALAYRKEVRSMKAYILKKLQPRSDRTGGDSGESIQKIRSLLSDI